MLLSAASIENTTLFTLPKHFVLPTSLPGGVLLFIVSGVTDNLSYSLLNVAAGMGLIIYLGIITNEVNRTILAL